MKAVDIWEENGKWYARIFAQTEGPFPSYWSAMQWLQSQGEYQS